MWAPHEQPAREVEKVKVEHVSPDGAATHLHIVDGDTVWLDTDVGVEDGLVIGVGPTRREAIADAILELRARLIDLEQLGGEQEQKP